MTNKAMRKEGGSAGRADSPLLSRGRGVLGPVEALHLVVEAAGEGAEHRGLADGQGARQAHLRAISNICILS